MPTTSPRVQDVLDGLVDLVLADGFARLGVADLARRLQCSKTTLYAVASSKEQIVERAVREFFRRSTERVDAAVDPEADPLVRIDQYLAAIARELAPASEAFFEDVAGFEPARRLYQHNTRAAADRVRDLVQAAAPSADGEFVGAVAGLVMEAIHRGELQDVTGRDDAASYRALGALVLAAVGQPRP